MVVVINSGNAAMNSLGTSIELLDFELTGVEQNKNSTKSGVGIVIT